MDFLKEIVKEVGGEYTKLASVFYWKDFFLSRRG